MEENEKLLEAINIFKKATDLFNHKRLKESGSFFLDVINILEKELLNEDNLIYLVDSFKHLGEIYFSCYSDWNKAQKYLIKYLSYDKKITFSSSSYYMLAYCFRQNGSHKLAYENFRRAYKIARTRHEWEQQILTVNEISNYYFFIGKLKFATRLKESALKMIEKYSKHLKEEKKNYLYYILYYDISVLYSTLEEKKKAWEYFEKSMAFNISPKRDYEEYHVYITAIKYAIEAEDIEKAKKYWKLLSKQKNSFNEGTMVTYYEITSSYYEAEKNYDKALEFQKKYFNANKAYLDNTNKNEMLELQSKYEVEKKKQEKEIFRIENKELKNINLSKDKFFSIIAHDLRSPFATIYSFISLMKKHHKNLSKEKIMELISELEQIVTNTYSLLENLLEWSRMQSGVIVYQPTNLDIKDVASHVISLTTLQASQKNIEIVNEIKKSHIVFADGFMVRTILRNLLNNAIKFTKSGGKIVVKQKQEKEKLTVFVADNGIGMSKEAQGKLFKLETSFSTSGTNQEKGTGLGLILCKEFVKKNKGNIFVESEPDKGTTFYFTLPLLNKKGINDNGRKN